MLQDTANAVQLGYHMEKLIFDLADTHFFFNDLEVTTKIFTSTLKSLLVYVLPLAYMAKLKLRSHAKLHMASVLICLIGPGACDG